MAAQKFFYGGSIWYCIKMKADVGSNERMNAFTAIRSSSGRLTSSDTSIEFTRNYLRLSHYDIQTVILLTL